MENNNDNTPNQIKKDHSALIGALVGFAIFAVIATAIIATFNITSVRNWFASWLTLTDERYDSIHDGNNSIFNNESVETVAASVMKVTVSVLVGSNGSFSTGAGTGIVVSSDGYILTNKHVVDGAQTVAIMHNDILYSDAQVVGTDPLNDVAFIKVNGVNGWEVANLGDSRTLKIGQPAIAVGYALGQFQNSVTSGVVSGVGRGISASSSDGGTNENLSDMIQTDAAINLGNSGGPLANAGGQVIGINTAVSASGNNLGFAIPIGATKGMLRHLLETGKVERAMLGVRYLDIDASVVAEYDLPVNRGAYLANEQSIISGGPAANAGLQAGDIITKVGSFEVGVNGNLSTLLGEYTIGDRIELTVRRGQEYKTFIATLAKY
ncbi:MAG: trypsin-like peptidase domain-containing protein [Candidatus Nomurabacteria bacterium]|jgi:S1-C subfamily serine protease|nr:trypsin-like peptidase domain-containing protein [Candidatus Nomurabacteria bacterium]